MGWFFIQKNDNFEYMKLKNKYFILRHGEALSNVKNITSCWPEKNSYPLTKKGRAQIRKAAEKLDKEKIDFIFSSDLLRTKQTAEIAGKYLKINPKYDKRLREYNFGVYNGVSLPDYKDNFGDQLERFRLRPKKGENYTDITDRMFSFFNESEKKYNDKNILIISHQIPIILLISKIENLSPEAILKKYLKSNRIKNGEIVKL
jgi:isoleucyl-tRNA synthetase